MQSRQQVQAICDARRHAIADVAEEGNNFDKYGLTFDEALEILRSMTTRLPLIEIVRQVNESAYAKELLPHLSQILGNRAIEMVAVEEFVRNGAGTRDEYDIQPFTDAYWSSRITERLAIGDYRRAWDEIGRASRGLLPPEYRGDNANVVPEPDYFRRSQYDDVPRYMRMSPERIMDFIDELYGAMHQKGLVDEVFDVSVKTHSWHTVKSERKPVPYDNRRKRESEHMVPKPGWQMLERLRPHITGYYSGVVTPSEQRLLAIAKYFSSVNAEKRRQRNQRLREEYTSRGM